MENFYLIGVNPGAIDKLSKRIVRAGGTVHHSDAFSSTMKVTGVSLRELTSFPGVRFVQGEGRK